MSGNLSVLTVISEEHNKVAEGVLKRNIAW